MNFNEIISELISSLSSGNKEEATSSVKYWFHPEVDIYVKYPERYFNSLDKLYNYNEVIKKRFSRKIIIEYINNTIPQLYKTEEEFSSEDYFKFFLSREPKNMTVIAPISGVRLDGNINEFKLSIFNFGYFKNLDLPIIENDGMFISIQVNDIYDAEIAISKAENSFTDFARLICFISGKLDKSIHIKTGLPYYPSYNNQMMYVSTSSYQIMDSDGMVNSSRMNNLTIEKIPVNNEFFCNNINFNRIWALYEKQFYGSKLNDIEKRIINAAIATGESSLTHSIKNSVIYTCISLETLFSFDEKELFQRSIGERLASLFTFIVAEDKDSRLKVQKVVKRIYGLRSSIVHGGDKALTNENLEINELVRSAINKLLNEPKYEKIKKISELNDLLIDAQNSY